MHSVYIIFAAEHQHNTQESLGILHSVCIIFAAEHRHNTQESLGNMRLSLHLCIAIREVRP